MNKIDWLQMRAKKKKKKKLVLTPPSGCFTYLCRVPIYTLLSVSARLGTYCVGMRDLLLRGVGYCEETIGMPACILHMLHLLVAFFSLFTWD